MRYLKNSSKTNCFYIVATTTKPLSSFTDHQKTCLTDKTDKTCNFSCLVERNVCFALASAFVKKLHRLCHQFLHSCCIKIFMFCFILDAFSYFELVIFLIFSGFNRILKLTTKKAGSASDCLSCSFVSYSFLHFHLFAQLIYAALDAQMLRLGVSINPVTKTGWNQQGMVHLIRKKGTL